MTLISSGQSWGRLHWKCDGLQYNITCCLLTKSLILCYFCLLMDCPIWIDPHFFKSCPFFYFIFWTRGLHIDIDRVSLAVIHCFLQKPRKVWIFCDPTPKIPIHLSLFCFVVKRLQTVFSHRASVILLHYPPPLFSFFLCWINSSRGGHSLQGQRPLTPSPLSRTWHSLRDHLWWLALNCKVHRGLLHLYT